MLGFVVIHFNTEFSLHYRFCFCALHAHMRLTESLTKVIYQRAIDGNKTEDLNRAFEEHLGLKGRFKQKQASDSSAGSSNKVWKRLGLKGYECFPFSKALEASDAFPAESAIERVLRVVWPSRVDAQQAQAAQAVPIQPAAAPGLAPQAPPGPPAQPQKAASGRGKGKTKAVSAQAGANANLKDQTAQEEARFIDLSCHLWRKFHVVTKQMRCKDPQDSTLRDFGKNARDLGARWCILLPRNRCNALYLHTVMMHGGAFMTYLLPGSWIETSP